MKRILALCACVLMSSAALCDVTQFPWRVRVQLPNGHQEVETIMASSESNARALAEAQYGRRAVMSIERVFR